MPLTVIAEGTQAAVIDTEHTLATSTAGKTFVFVTDLATMTQSTANGMDRTELRIYTIARSGGTERLAYSVIYAGTQQQPIKYSVPVPADVSAKFTLKQTVGVGRSYPWKVLALD